MSVSYRVAEQADADELAVIHTSSWRAAYRGLVSQEALDALDPRERAEQFRVLLDRERRQERGVVWRVAEVDGVLAGHVGAQLIDGVGHLHLLYLAPDYWRRGIGHALHEQALDALVQLGATSARLKVLDGNDRAIAFYEERGWTFTGEAFEEEIGGVHVSDRQMSIALGVQ